MMQKDALLPFPEVQEPGEYPTEHDINY